MLEPIITLNDFMQSEYNGILNAPVILQIGEEKIEVNEEVSTPEFFKKYENYKIVEIRPTIKAPTQEDIEEEYGLPDVTVHFEQAFLVVLENIYEESEDKEDVETLN